jgi:hypothetical protein
MKSLKLSMFLRTVVVLIILMHSISKVKAQEIPYYTITDFWGYVDERFGYYDSVRIAHNGNMSGTGYTQFIRWYCQWRQIVVNDESYDTALSYQLKGILKLTQDYISDALKTENMNMEWNELGPVTCPINYNNCFDQNDYKTTKGPGRISFIEFHPDYAENHTIFAGSPTGGLFYSTDSGNNWKNGGTDFLPVPGISHFQIDAESNTWFIATGDADCGWRSSAGIWRSTNEGINWEPINMGLGIPNPANSWWEKQCRKILIDPSDGDVMFAVFFDGIYKTENALQENVSWIKVPIEPSRLFFDIVYKPSSNNQILYASGKGNTLFYSTDSGDSWAVIPGSDNLAINPDAFLIIRVTPDDPSLLYVAEVFHAYTNAYLYEYTYN